MSYAGRSFSCPTAIPSAAFQALTQLSLDAPKAKPEEIWVHPESRDQMLADLHITNKTGPFNIWGVPLVTAEWMPLEEVHIMGKVNGDYKLLARCKMSLIHFEEIPK